MTVRQSREGDPRPSSGAGARARPLPEALERRLDFFEYLSPEARDDFQKAGGLRRFRAGERIYSQGERHQVMYRIVVGRVWLSYARADGREHASLLLGPGECLGLSSLIDGEELPQSAIARTDVVTEVVDRAALNRLRARHRSVDGAILRSILRDVRILISQLSEASLADLPPRLARRLLVLATERGDAAPIVPLTQTELSAVFGVSRQTLNKVLRQFESQGMVRLSYGEIQLVDVERLDALSRLV